MDQLSKENVRAALAADVIFDDGWVITAPEAYTEFFDVHAWKIVHTIKSDTTSGKTTIYGKDGEILPEVYGVYNLTFLEALASKLGIEGKPYFGRGATARDLVERIEKWAHTDLRAD